jgi:hypothetical protein
MVDKILQWLMDLISNPLFVMGLVFIFLASFLKDEKLVNEGKLKPATIYKRTLRPLPVWAYTLMIGTGILITLSGVLQISGVFGAVSHNPDVLKLEDLPYWAFSYGFGKDFDATRHFSSLSVVNDSGSIKSYKLSYSMPLQGDAAAGLSFILAEPIDLSGYSSVKFTAHFSNSQCDLFMKDTSGDSSFVTVSDAPPESMRPAAVNGKWQLTIDLTNFSTIDQRAVKEIGCNALRCEGSCVFELSEIQFIKP